MEKARQTACVNNLNQIGKACAQYVQDWDENEVPQGTKIGSSSSYNWPTLLYPYIISAQSNSTQGIFWCPSAGSSLPFGPDPKLVRTVGAANSTIYCSAVSSDGSTATGLPNYQSPGKLSYSMNVIESANWSSKTPTGVTRSPTWNSLKRFGFNNGTTAFGHGVALSLVEDPSGTIQIVDAMAGRATANPDCSLGGSSMYALDTETNTDRYPDAETSKPSYRHNGGFNAEFADGHVKWLKYGHTTPCMWTVQADPYDTDPASIAAECK